MVTGQGNLTEIAEKYGYKKAIDIQELYSLFPDSCPSLYMVYDDQWRERRVNDLMLRMQKLGYDSVESLKIDLKIKAIMLLSDPVNLEMNI